MQSVARSIAGLESCSSRSVSWPRRTVSFSRAKTANESLAAASTTTSLIELEPTSMAAIFMTRSIPETRLILTQRAQRFPQGRAEENLFACLCEFLGVLCVKDSFHRHSTLGL